MKTISRKIIMLLLLSSMNFASIGCMGWFDLFAEKRSLPGGFYLMQDEDPDHNAVCLFYGKSSGSISGQIHQIGWDESFILFPIENIPSKSWNVVAIKGHQQLIISESQRNTDLRFKSIKIMLSSKAWKMAKR